MSRFDVHEVTLDSTRSIWIPRGHFTFHEDTMSERVLPSDHFNSRYDCKGNVNLSPSVKCYIKVGLLSFSGSPFHEILVGNYDLVPEYVTGQSTNLTLKPISSFGESRTMPKFDIFFHPVCFVNSSALPPQKNMTIVDLIASTDQLTKAIGMAVYEKVKDANMSVSLIMTL